MITLQQAETLTGRTMVGTGGKRIGKIAEVFLDDETGQPEFATVSTGLFGTKHSFVPLAQAQVSSDSLQVPYTKDQVKGAPVVDEDEVLSQEEESRLYAHYGLGYTERTSDSGLPTSGGAPTTGTTTAAASASTGVGQSTSARTVPAVTQDNAMTRSEERLRVGTQRVETGKARLRKFVVTERQQARVQVAHEELRVTREPITDATAGAAYDGPAISDAVHEVVLHAERPVVEKEVVPVERIRLGTQTVVEDQTVTAEVRKEEVELIDPEGRRTDVDSDPTA